MLPESTKLKILGLGYTRELLIPPEREKGEASKRLGGYADFLNKYFVLIFSLKKHRLKERKMGRKKNMIVIPTNGINRLHALLKMYQLGKKICQENDIDVIQAQDPIFTGFIGYLLKRKYKIPLNICVYGPDPYDKNWLREKKTNLILAPIAKYIINQCDGIQVDGKKVMNSLMARGIPAEKIFYKPMVPQEIKRFKEAKGKVLRKKLLKNEEQKILLFVGRLVKQKNIPFLLRCYQKVVQKFSRARLVIIGQGQEEEKLKKIVEKLKIQNKIDWVKSVPYSEMPEYFQAADIFVLPSLYEGFPRVLMEAAMAGLPIVSTNVGGTEDVIVDNENGFIISQSNEKEFVERILYLLKNSEIAKRMGKRGQEIMKKKFDPKKLLLKQILIWNKVVQK